MSPANLRRSVTVTRLEAERICRRSLWFPDPQSVLSLIRTFFSHPFWFSLLSTPSACRSVANKAVAFSESTGSLRWLGHIVTDAARPVSLLSAVVRGVCICEQSAAQMRLPPPQPKPHPPPTTTRRLTQECPFFVCAFLVEPEQEASGFLRWDLRCEAEEGATAALDARARAPDRRNGARSGLAPQLGRDRLWPIPFWPS